MSSIALSGNASGAGVFTIASPNSASSYTATLPTATTTLVGTDATQTLTNKTLTTPNIDSAQIATVSGTAPLYMCRAWVNFNGIGTVAIRASGNVSSITDNGVGYYTVNFTTAMVDENYSVAGTAQRPTANADNIMIVNGSTTYNQLTTTAAVIRTIDSAATDRDSIYVGVAIFR
jgi:hypothetical protein